MSIACGVCLLLVECVYRLLNVANACGVCLLRFNVSNACLKGLMLVKCAVACLMCGMLL